MALKLDLQTPHGLSLKGAILVVTALADNSQSRYQYQVPARPGPNGKYQAHVQNGPSRSGQFQVSIFASEKTLRDGLPAVGHLPNEQGQPTFQMSFTGENGEQIGEAYEHLKEQYPEAVEIEVTELGLK
ncbi:MAG: hypothetical protein OQJ95_01000 [Kangiella sp.]|nr:hypothetical protein [Kangiella sp.]MCW9029659.1 hypothetical protein [Kangiella sp.]